MSILTRRATLKALASVSCAIAASRALPAYAATTSVKVALDWTPNTNHVGLYVAQQKNYFKDAGLDVQILPYTDTSAGTLVSNGAADFGVNGVGFFNQHAAGADQVAVYAVVQSDTGRLVTTADRQDIKSPKDLTGKTYGGFGSDWEKTLVSAMIEADGGKPDFNSVTLGTSAYEALANHTVDFTLEILTWEGVEAELKGQKLKAFKYSDYGVPEQYTTVLVSSSKYLKANPTAASAFIKAVEQGYAFAADHPDEAADILIAANADSLTNKELVHTSMKMLAEQHFLRSASGQIGTMTPAVMDKVGNFLFEKHMLLDGNGEVLKEKPDFSTYYSNALLNGA